MERQVGRKLPRLQELGSRRALLIFLAFAYLFVGLAHSCPYQAIAFGTVLDIGVGSDDGPDVDDTKKWPVVAGHCSVCAPALMPALVEAAGPSARPVKVSFFLTKTHFKDHPRLDTPPPKHLI